MLNMVLGSLLASVLLILLVVYLYVRLRKEREEMFQDYNRKIVKIQLLQAQLDSLAKQSLDYKTAMDELERKIALISEEKKKVEEEKRRLIQNPSYQSAAGARIKTSPIYSCLVSKASKGEKASEEDFNELSDTVDSCYPNFKEQLYACLPDVTASNIHLCLLLKAGFRTKEIAVLMCQTQAGISHKKARLYTKIENKPASVQSLEDLFSTI